MDVKNKGKRVRTVSPHRTRQGQMLPRHSEGKILSETENLGRQLILVDWDCGLQSHVFPTDIELLEKEEQCTST